MCPAWLSRIVQIRIARLAGFASIIARDNAKKVEMIPREQASELPESKRPSPGRAPGKGRFVCGITVP